MLGVSGGWVDVVAASGMGAVVVVEKDEREKMSDDMTPLAEAAASLHEMFVSLLAAGFNERQALELVKGMVAQQAGSDDGDDEGEENG